MAHCWARRSLNFDVKVSEILGEIHILQNFDGAFSDILHRSPLGFLWAKSEENIKFGVGWFWGPKTLAPTPTSNYFPRPWHHRTVLTLA